MFHDLSILALGVAAVLPLLIGALWYSPLLFAKPWMKAQGHTPESLAARRPRMGRLYGFSLLAYFVMAYVLANLMHWTGMETVGGGLHLGALCWFGFAATFGLTAQLFSDKPISAYLIDAGFQLVMLAAMGAVLGAWAGRG